MLFGIFLHYNILMKKKGRYNPYVARKEKEKKYKERAEELFPENEFEEFWKKHYRDIENTIYDALLDSLAGDKVYTVAQGAFGKTQKQEIHKGNIEKFCENLPKKLNGVMLREQLPELPHVIYSILLNCDNMPLVEFAINSNEKAAGKIVMNHLRETKRLRTLADGIKERLTELVVFEQLSHNPRYTNATARLKKTMAARKLLFESIQTSTPDDYTKLFPLARKMERHFILHLGPTNSGKTYQAMEELMAAENGIYLAPLRLLAYEQYEKMNRAGCPCSMITGEEQILMPGSFHQSSTIEMLNLSDEWEMAVIDEAQMVADRQRGGSWTAAILGIRAKVIHVCASLDAERILTRMITSCGDTMEVMYHERKTPLEMDSDSIGFRFPEDVQKGDALIVFSRKDVHSVAAELQQAGKKCSIIYGSLPYDVRHREAGKFADGVTDVVVATDAIGMGMNLPIRRVVFLQTIKYDGINERPLTSSEVKQIAGRAGRFGIYDTGYVASYYDYEMIERLLNHKMISISKAMINIPEEFLEKNGKVSTILEMWNQIPAAEYYDKGDIEEKIKVARALESVDDDRELIRKFIRIPANPDNKVTFDIYLDFYRALAQGRPVPLHETMEQHNSAFVNPGYKQALSILETSSAVYDFLYSFTRMFGDLEDLTKILEIKRQISEKIFIILDMQKLAMKSCMYCGKKLKWSYQYTMCQECYRKRHIQKRGW